MSNQDVKTGLLTDEQISQLDWEKVDNLMPAIIQHAVSGEVLMLGYMNQEALGVTQSSGKVTFYSRTKERLWTKGETSENYLNVVSITPDCDNDTLLVLVNPVGPTCHKGNNSCFHPAETDWRFCISSKNCSPRAKPPIRKARIPPNFTPAVPNASHKKSVKKALKLRWPPPSTTALN